MYRRLWWKDARQFWPIWAFLFLVGGVAHLLVHHYASPESRMHLLLWLPMGWAALYAFAVGAAAFAGERETGTLALLDVLAASRRAVWVGKVSFAFVSTFALGLILLAFALLELTPSFSPWWIGRTLVQSGILLLQCLAWALFCSAVLPGALFAAVAAILLTALGQFLIAEYINNRLGGLAGDLALVPVLLAFSLIAFAWGRRGRLWRIGFELRSPVVVSWAGGGAPAARGRQSPEPVETPAAPTPATIAAPTPGRFLAPAIWSADRPRPRSRFAELRFLMSQTMREGRSTWLLLMAIGLVCPALILFANVEFNRLMDTPLPLFCCGTIALVAGSSVFGLENRRRTYRWLVQHGARPGLVWLGKLVPWLFGLALILGPQAYLAVQGPLGAGAIEGGMLMAVGVPVGFAVAVLCGMAIPRGITALTVALVMALALGGGEYAMMRVGLVPFWATLFPPAAILVVTWAWRGDWLLDRPAPGRWVRLGLMLAATLGTSLAGYAGYRAWSVPDVGPIPRPGRWAAGPLSPEDDRNAAGLYREAARRLGLFILRPPYVVTVTPEPPDLDRHPEAFELIRRAVARPECRFYDPDTATLLKMPDPAPMGPMADAVLRHTWRRLDNGDLAATWDDIMIVLRIARHTAQGAALVQGFAYLESERQALRLARRWADARGQTPDRLHAAIAAYRDLPPMPPAADVIRAEGLLAERSIDAPRADLLDWIVDDGTRAEPRRTLSTSEVLLLDVIATPWERARARRLNRLFTSSEAQLAEVEPWQRPAVMQRFMAAGFDAWLSCNAPGGGRPESLSLLAMFQPMFQPYVRNDDTNEVERRATLLYLAVREWQLRHDGRFPSVLEALVPEELPSLPLDPFTGRPFGYTTFAKGNANRPAAWPRINWAPDTRLIYSAGTDGQDNGGEVYSPDRDSPGDMVFPIPSEPARPGADGDQPGPGRATGMK